MLIHELQHQRCTLNSHIPFLADNQLSVQLVTNWISHTVTSHIVPPLRAYALRHYEQYRVSKAREANVKAHEGEANADSAQKQLKVETRLELLARAAASVAEGIKSVREGRPNTVTPEILWLRLNVEASVPLFNETPLFMAALVNCGYVLLFGPAFSLAPLIAMGINAISGIVDLDLALRRSSRCVPQSAQDLGAWLRMFELLAFIGVLTNSLVVAFAVPSPVFRHPGWDTDTARLGWFLAAETFIFAFKHLWVR